MPGAARVPSGKNTTEVPPANRRAAAAKTSRARLRSSRSTGMKPPSFIDQPKIGMRNRLRLAAKRSAAGAVANSSRMSK